MAKLQTEETDVWRVLLFARNGSELLLLRRHSGLCLPELRIPRCHRVVPNLNAEAKRVWGLDTVCLVPFDIPHPDNATERSVNYYAMELRQAEELTQLAPNSMEMSALKGDAFADLRDYSAVRRAMELDGVCFGEERRAPFSKFGAFERISAWVEEQLPQLGLWWDGAFGQLQASDSFALVRFQTNRGAVWFKAVGEPNIREFPVTMELAARLPEHVPVLLARHAKWNAWLTREAEGQDLFSSWHRDAWCTAAVSLANLQIASLAHAPEILAAGARDVRTQSLLALTWPFFSAMDDLMEQQSKPEPQRLTREEMKRTRHGVSEALAELGAGSLPDAIDHLDLNPGNVLVAPGKCTFLDWAEAAVGNPFFSIEYLRQHFLRAFPGDADAEAEFLGSYLSRWRRILPSKAIQTAISLAPLAALFAYAASSLPWHDPDLNSRPGFAGFLRSLVRRMYRESEQLRTSRAA